ncbi:GGDEF domain-containing protein [Rhizobium sp. CG5]|uniref:GGDEF domain-containing protein n=1 Tax=Rhizobium sp. CG5 TaxID=2726076 RepID=UPI00203405ED|nr:GGDEF domain-containing protein [Rhizobium sp. CG5]MCM2475581.1 GGDEF domain-containing protein [Rhizobium sp. CG5]
MRFTEMLNPYAFVGSEIVSEHQIVATIRELYSSKPHIAATLGICLAALSGASSGSVRLCLLAASIAVGCLLFRIFIEFRFITRPPGAFERKWIRLFVTGSLMSGVGWGFSGALLLCSSSPTTQIIIMGVVCAIVQGAAGRAYMMPGTAFLNIISVLGQISIAALMGGNPILAVLALVYFWILSSFIVQMVKNRMIQLHAEHRATQLLEEITEKNELLRISNEKLAATAFEDSLTGLANRRKFDIAIVEALANAKRDNRDISLMIIDVDHFKAFNDNYGHQAGDQCLQILSNAISLCIPDDGLVARYGGEEFVVLLPNYDQASAVILAERTRLAVQFAGLSNLPKSPPHQTISIGLISCRPDLGLTPEELLSGADAALYDAKRKGRNCLRITRQLRGVDATFNDRSSFGL